MRKVFWHILDGFSLVGKLIKLLIALSICFIAAGWAVRDFARNDAPRVTIVMPYDYCGDFLLHIEEDPTAYPNYEPGDRLHFFNLTGEHGLVIKVPDLSQGIFRGFAFYNPTTPEHQYGLFRQSTTGITSTIYEITPIHVECDNPFVLDYNTRRALVRGWIEDGLMEGIQ